MGGALWDMLILDPQILRAHRSTAHLPPAPTDRLRRRAWRAGRAMQAAADLHGSRVSWSTVPRGR